MVGFEDRTRRGYILGASENRSKEVTPERDMSPSAVALLRFLTHASLYIASVQPALRQEVAALVMTPEVKTEGIAAFFLSHLYVDLSVLQQLFGKSCDDIFLLLHAFCHSIAQRKPGQSVGVLKTKLERREWEKRLTTSYVNVLLQDCDEKINKGNSCLVNDTQRGDNQLLNLVYEVGEDGDESSEGILYETAAAWKYRSYVTVDHFFRQFELLVQSPRPAELELPLLKLFHEEAHHLRALFFLPKIMSLQRHLIKQLQHRLDRKDMNKYTILDMMGRKNCQGLCELKEVFSKAWDIVKHALRTHSCFTSENDLVSFPENMHNACVNDNSPVGMLLADAHGPGRCAYLMIHYLLVQHNHIMQRYCGIPFIKQKFDQVPEVPVSKVSKRHLIGYSPEADLLPLILAHCNYSLHLGHEDSTTSKLEYDFPGFELQLRNTLFLGKSRVKREPDGSMEIETLMYCADTMFSKLFEKLGEKVKQVPLSSRVQRQITDDFNDSLPEISQSIDSLNTALVYLLKDLKVDPDGLIHTFMTDTLKMTNSIYSQKARQDCCLKHVKALWLLLSEQRSRFLARHHEEAFDNQGTRIRKELEKEQKQELNRALRHLQPERVDQLLTNIFECIILQLFQHTDEDSADPDGYDLRWLVSDNIENPLLEDDSQGPVLTNAPAELTVDDLDNFPDSIMASQAIPCWLEVHAHLTARRE